MDTKDTAEKTAPSAAPAKPSLKLRRGEPEPEEPVPSVPLSGPGEDSLEGLGAAFRGLSVGGPKGKEKENVKGAVDMGVEEEDPGNEHHPSDEVPFNDKPAESAPAVRSATTTTLQATHPVTSSPVTNPPMAEGLGFTGMPYPTYGVTPVATAQPMTTAVSESVAFSSTYTAIHEPAPLRSAEGYHRPPAGVGPIYIPGYAAPEPGYFMPAPGFASLGGLLGAESCGGRTRGSGRSSNRSLTRSEIKRDSSQRYWRGSR